MLPTLLDELRLMHADIPPIGRKDSKDFKRPYKIIITVATALPPRIRSRCYQWIRDGAPVFFVLHREGDEDAITDEVRDHIAKAAATALRAYDDTDYTARKPRRLPKRGN